MRFSVREIGSLIVGLGGVLAMAYAVNTLLDTGSCGNARPYVSARPCPTGTGLVAVLLVGGFFVTFAGLLLSEQGFKRPGAGQIIWCAMFLGGGVAILVKLLTQPGVPADARLGGYIMAAVFIPAGLPVAIMPFLAQRKERAAASAPPPEIEPARREARATVTSVTDLGTVDGVHHLKIAYTIQSPDGPRIEVERSREVAVGAGLPRVGDRLMIRYSPTSPTEFEEVRTVSRGPRTR